MTTIQYAHPKIKFAPKFGRWSPKSFQCQTRTAFWGAKEYSILYISGAIF